MQSIILAISFWNKSEVNDTTAIQVYWEGGARILASMKVPTLQCPPTQEGHFQEALGDASGFTDAAPLDNNCVRGALQ